jgi:hypothetical protein
MSYLFGGTLFLSAALLFLVEPLVAKMILPLLGGSPAVWNTCLVFFQAALLGGYLYAHALTGHLTPRLQAAVHLGLLLLGALVLPIGLSAGLVADLPHDTDPAWWLLRVLAVAVGLPFLVVSASAPLLQRWFAAGGQAGARDPYFLYAASNCGSMVALMGYPFLLEPTLPLAEQSWFWAGGYGALVVLTAVCFFVSVPSSQFRVLASEKPDDSGLEPQNSELSWRRRFHWVVLAFVPSSLLLGVTTYITLDVAAIPLLWVIPLALYLLSFILVFSPRELLPHAWMVRALPVVALVAFFVLLRSTALAALPLIPLHWLVLFTAAMVCHGELARDRPPPRRLTEFYLWISIGGVLGGVFNALLAPLIFQSGAFEYPLALLLACLLRPGPRLRESTSVDRWLDLILPAVVGVTTLGMTLAVRFAETPHQLSVPVLLGVVAVMCYLLAPRPLRFTLAVGAALVALKVAVPTGGHTLYTARNFFGLVRVHDLKADDLLPRDERGKNDTGPSFRVLSHGSTNHGMQRLDAGGQPVHDCEPLSYFHRSGPVGDVFEVFDARVEKGELPPRVAVTGLGVGALAAYARPGAAWTYYEIDPAVRDVAEDPAFFTYLADARARGATVNILLGDARQRLRDAPEHGYGLIILDAFSSDAVPVHLLCREALALYNAKRAPGGLLLFNITNRYLDFRRVLAQLAADAGMVCFYREDAPAEEDQRAWAEQGKAPSQWIVLADRLEDLDGVADDVRWQRLRGPGIRPWTDAFSNVFQVLRWR